LDGGELSEPNGSPLTDTEIAKRLTEDGVERLIVSPIVDKRQFGSTTLDVRLGTRWKILNSALFQSLDPRRSDEIEYMLQRSYEEFRMTAGQSEDFVLHPGELVLALSLEFIQLPPDLWALLEGRSTWARVGLQGHATAGMIDPGFSGYLTFELQNMGRIPLSLFPGLRVGQIAFFHLGEVARPYSLKHDAAYTSQYSVQTKFANQAEHVAMTRYIDSYEDGFAGEQRDDS
jgi:dCTP deaminase